MNKFAALLGASFIALSAGMVVPLRAQATVNSPQVSTSAVGNGSTTTFTYPFIIPYQANGSTPAVTVTLTTGGVTTTLPPSSYSITGVGNPAGGYVTYPLVGSPITSGTTITITRSLAYIQPTAVSNSSFYPHTVETVADNLAMQIQQLAAGGSGGGGGGSGVSSFNSRTGAVTLNSSDVTTALGYTPAAGLTTSNILAGTGISVTPSGPNVTIAATGSGSQTVTQVGTIAALRALTSVAVPTVIAQTYSTAGDGGGGTFYYNASDTTTADNGCTIFVDAASHRWYRSYSGAVNVRWCGAKGDGSTDDKTAFQNAILAGTAVYVPPSPTCYITSGSFQLSSNKKLYGDGPSSACIKASGANYPIITTIAVGPLPSSTPGVYSLNKLQVDGLTLDRAVAATSGGDGIQWTNYTTNSSISNMYITNQWNGINGGSTDFNTIQNVNVTGNYNDGIHITNTSYSAIQWYLDTVGSTQNNGQGFNFFTSVGPALLPSATLATSVSMGTMTNLTTYANRYHGFNASGLSTGGGGGGTSPIALQSVRINGGFFGEDGDSEVYLDTYGSGHVVQPTFTELAGTRTTGRTFGFAQSNIGSGIELTLNNTDAFVTCGRCVNNSFDGLLSSATYLTVGGGSFVNNGLAAFASRQNGIYIYAGTGVVLSGFKSGNVNGSSGTQLYSIASNIDNVAVSGCDLRGYKTGGSYYAFSGGLTNTVVSGCLPSAANIGGSSGLPLSGGTITGDLVVNGTITSGTDLITNGTLHVNGVSAFAAGVNVTASAGVAITNGLTVKDVAISRSLGVGTGASGATGRIDASSFVGGSFSGTTASFSSALSAASGTFSGSVSGTTVTSSVDLVANGTFHANGASAFTSGGITVTSGGMTFTTGVGGNGITVDNIAVNKSIGVGTGASGATGRIDLTSGIYLNGTQYTNP